MSAEREEARLRAAFQGERGAFSEDAARQLLGSGFETIPCRTFEEMFETVSSGAADCAVVPIVAGPTFIAK